MADEITMTGSLQIRATNMVEAFQPPGLSIDLASNAGSGGSQSIGTAVEAIAKGDTTNGGVFFFRNTDETNFVEIGPTSDGSASGTFFPTIKLLAGEYAMGRLASADIFARSNTAATILQFRMLSP